jgi:surface antigen
MIDLLVAGLEPPKSPLLEFATDNAQEEQVTQVTTHTVVENDTLEKIGKAYGVEWQRIFYKNTQIDHQDHLEVGMVITIPTADEKLTERHLHPQLVNTATTSRNTTVRTARPSYSVSSSWYDWGWCTYYVSTQRPVGAWNNASEWIWQAQRDGWATGSTPAVGAIAQKNNHVAIVRSVSGNSMTIQEMNYEGFGVISSRTIPSDGWRFIY